MSDNKIVARAFRYRGMHILRTAPWSFYERDVLGRHWRINGEVLRAELERVFAERWK